MSTIRELIVCLLILAAAHALLYYVGCLVIDVDNSVGIIL